MEKKKAIRCYPPCARLDIERMESWLTDMAAQGWHLCESGRKFRFRQGEPKRVRYRLEPRTGTMDYTAMVLFEEMGWEPVAEHSYFYIFRDRSPEAPELNTDPQVQLRSMKKMRFKTVFWNLLALALIPVIFMGRFQEIYRFLITFGAVGTVAFLSIYLFYVSEIIVQMVQANAIVQKLKKGIPLDHKKPWKKGAWYHRTTRVMLRVCYLMFCLLLVFREGASLMRYDSTDFMNAGEQPFATIQDFCPDGTYTPGNFGPYCSITEYASDCAYKNVEWLEYAEVVTPEGEIYKGAIIVHYHETVAPWLARGLAEEYLRVALKDRYNHQIEAPELGVDYVAAYAMGDAPTVILQKGNIVITATVTVKNGDENMVTAWTEKMLEMLPK